VIKNANCLLMVPACIDPDGLLRLISQLWLISRYFGITAGRPSSLGSGGRADPPRFRLGRRRQRHSIWMDLLRFVRNCWPNDAGRDVALAMRTRDSPAPSLVGIAFGMVSRAPAGLVGSTGQLRRSWTGQGRETSCVCCVCGRSRRQRQQSSSESERVADGPGESNRERYFAHYSTPYPFDHRLQPKRVASLPKWIPSVVRSASARGALRSMTDFALGRRLYCRIESEN
jgi:hypothetical protein